MPSNHLIIPFPPLLFLSSAFPNIRVCSNELALRIRWPKYWSFTFGISPFNEHSELISFRIDWFDLFVVQGSLRVFSSTTVWKHQFFGTQLYIDIYNKVYIGIYIYNLNINLYKERVIFVALHLKISFWILRFCSHVTLQMCYPSIRQRLLSFRRRQSYWMLVQLLCISDASQDPLALSS